MPPRIWTQDEIDDDYFASQDDGMDEEEEFWAEAELLCHMHADGQCGAAGSEYCDFECPFRD